MSPEFEQLVGRAVSDKDFRDKLLADPEAAAKGAGIRLSDAELKQLKEGIERVKRSMSTADIDNFFGVASSRWYG
jgi:hypothetical protein